VWSSTNTDAEITANIASPPFTMKTKQHSNVGSDGDNFPIKRGGIDSK